MDNSILEHQNQKSNGKIAVPLSKAHIRPELTWHAGSSYFHTSKGVSSEQKGGGQRRGIKGFSKQSRRRMLYMIGKIRRDSDLPFFVTLTYPRYFPTVKQAKRDLKIFLQRLKRKYPEAGIVWKLEPQERGAPHYHMLVWAKTTETGLLAWVVKNWYDIAGQGNYDHFCFHMGWLHDQKTGKQCPPCVTLVYSFQGVWRYAAKYIGKTFEVAEWGSQWTGRFWGTVGKEYIPFGEEQKQEITYRQAVQIQREQRKYMARERETKEGKKRTKRLKKGSRNGLTTFCDADNWVNRLVPWASEQPGQTVTARAPVKELTKRPHDSPVGRVRDFGEHSGDSGKIESSNKFIKSGTLNGALEWMHRRDNTEQLELINAVVKGEVA